LLLSAAQRPKIRHFKNSGIGFVRPVLCGAASSESSDTEHFCIALEEMATAIPLALDGGLRLPKA